MEEKEIKKKLNDAFNKIYKAQEQLIFAKEAVYEVLVAKAENEAAQKDGWVSVKDHIPPDDKRVVVKTSAGATYFLHPIGGHFPKDVIEWYELPE